MCTELKFLTGHNHKCVWYKDQDHLFFSFCNAIHVVYTLFSFHVSIFLFLPYKWFAWTYFEISLHKMWLRNMINTKYWVNPNSNTELNCIFSHISVGVFFHMYTLHLGMTEKLYQCYFISSIWFHPLINIQLRKIILLLQFVIPANHFEIELDRIC